MVHLPGPELLINGVWVAQRETCSSEIPFVGDQPLWAQSESKRSVPARSTVTWGLASALTICEQKRAARAVVIDL